MNNGTPLKKHFSYDGTPFHEKTFYVVGDHAIMTFKKNGLKEDFLTWLFTAKTQLHKNLHSFPINSTTVLADYHKNDNFKPFTSGGLCVLKTGPHTHKFLVQANMDDFITDIEKAAKINLRRKKYPCPEPKGP